MNNLGDLLCDLAIVGDLPLKPMPGDGLSSVGGCGPTLSWPDILPGGVSMVEVWTGANGGTTLVSVCLEMMSMDPDSVEITKPA